MKIMNYFHSLSMKGRLYFSFGAIVVVIMVALIGGWKVTDHTHRLIEEKDILAEQAIKYGQ